LVGPGAGVPLGGRTAAGVEPEWILPVGRLAGSTGRIEEDARAPVGREEAAVLEESPFKGRLLHTALRRFAVEGFRVCIRPLDTAHGIQSFVARDAAEITGTST